MLPSCRGGILIKGNLEIPELDRLEKVQSDVYAIQSFLKWLLEEKHISLGSDFTFNPEIFFRGAPCEEVIYGRVMTRWESLIMEHFNISESILEDERQLILQLFNKD